jgi:hypothetical protein
MKYFEICVFWNNFDFGLTTRKKYFAIFAAWFALTMCQKAATKALCRHEGRIGHSCLSISNSKYLL